MIELRIQDHPIDLDEKSQVQLQAFNPALDDVLVARAFSWPFTIPTSGANLHALGHVNRLDAQHAGLTLPARVRVGGGTEWQGVVEVGSVRRDRLELVFKNVPRIAADTLNNTKLNEILETIQVPQNTLPWWELALSPAIGGLNHQVFINEVEYEVTSTGPGNIAAASLILVGLLNADYPGCASFDITLEQIRISPTLIQSANFDVRWNDAVIEIDFLAPGKARLLNFQDWVNGLLVSPAAEVVFPYVITPKLFYKGGEKKKGDALTHINFNYDGGYRLAIGDLTSESAEIDYKYAFIPMPRLSYLLDRICVVLGLGDWRIADYTRADMDAVWLWNNVLLESVSEEWRVVEVPGVPGATTVFFDARGYYLYYAQEIDLNEHVGEWSLGDFIVRIARLFNCHFNIESDALIFRPNVLQMLNSPLQASRFLTLDYEYEPKADLGVRIAFAQDKNDEYPVPTGQLEGVGTGEVIEVISSFADAEVTHKLVGTFEACATWYAGESTMFSVDGKSDQVRLAWAIERSFGSRVTLTSTHYALGSLPFAFELQDTTVTGLFNLYWRAWMPVLRGYELVLYLSFPAHRISILQEWLSVRMALAVDMGQVMVLPRSLELSEQMQGMGLLRMNCVMLR